MHFQNIDQGFKSLKLALPPGTIDIAHLYNWINEALEETRASLSVCEAAVSDEEYEKITGFFSLDELKNLESFTGGHVRVDNVTRPVLNYSGNYYYFKDGRKISLDGGKRNEITMNMSTPEAIFKNFEQMFDQYPFYQWFRHKHFVDSTVNDFYRVQQYWCSYYITAVLSRHPEILKKVDDVLPGEFKELKNNLHATQQLLAENGSTRGGRELITLLNDDDSLNGKDFSKLLMPRCNGLDEEKKNSLSSANIKRGITKINSVESSIPGLSLFKRPERVTIKYIPSFFQILDFAGYLYTIYEKDKTFGKEVGQRCTMHSFMLYIAYSLMYCYLRVADCNVQCSNEMRQALQKMEKAGYGRFVVPRELSHWIDAFGKYTDPNTELVFVPILPSISSSGYLEFNYAHLLPNFEGLLALTVLFCVGSTDNDDPYKEYFSDYQRDIDYALGYRFKDTPIDGTRSARENSYRYPGMSRLLQIETDGPGIVRECIKTLETENFNNSIEKYLYLNTDLLRALHEQTGTALAEHVDCVTISNPVDLGGPLCMLPLFTSELHCVRKPSTHTVFGCSFNTMHVPSQYEFSYILRSRTKVADPELYIAQHTPLIWIARDKDLVYGAKDPQDSWYSTENEFESQEFTMATSMSYVTLTH